MSSLAGKRILVTRAEHQAISLSEELKKVGGEPVEVPLLGFYPRNDGKNITTIARLHEYAWMIFTSSNGVKFFFDLWDKHGEEWPKDLKIAAVGEKTDEALRQHNHTADFMPSTYTAEVMADEFRQVDPDPGKVLVVRGNLSRDVLPEAFREQHVLFQTITVYDTLPMKENKRQLLQEMNDQPMDGLTFTSPSTIRAFHSFCEGEQQFEDWLHLPCLCIGPTTASEAERTGFKEIITPDSLYTVEGMVDALRKYFNQKG
ncbi:uroporphyrinogen-III synthase [Thalassobacillus hwangdonensis]|uniref:Uroporphyrinogen-III synthase n=1 Tax=Thalassobacillus hwangdonensis TaxID=546108 RepID=A0ABW3L1D9_9BACI